MRSRGTFAAVYFSVALVGWESHAGQRPPVVPVALPVQHETAAHDFVGTLAPVEMVELRARVTGAVGKVLRKEGDEVQRGDLVLELDPQPFEEQRKAGALRIKQHEDMLRRLQEAHKRASKLAAVVTQAALVKQIQAALAPLLRSAEKALPLAQAARKDDPFQMRQQPLRTLEDSLGLLLRLAKGGKKDNFDLLYQSELVRLYRASVAVLELPPVGGKPGPHKALSAELQNLRRAVEEVLTLSHARSKEGLAALAAERDVVTALLNTAKEDLARGEREVAFAKVTAPIAGRLTGLAVKAGDRVAAGATAGTLLGSIVRLNEVRVSFAVDPTTRERYRFLVRAGMIRLDKIADVRVSIAIGDEKGFPHRGHLELMGSGPAPKTERVSADALIPNGGGVLTPTALARAAEKRQVRVRVTLGEPRKVLLVAVPVVGTDASGKQFLLVVNNKKVVELRHVRTGPLVDGLQAIEQGLSAGDQVVVGTPRGKGSTEEKTLSPQDFVQDLRLLVRPGTMVEPVSVSMPIPRTSALGK